MKYYAVRNGRVPGVYATWAECEAQVKNFSGATYKSFKSQTEAEDFIRGDAAGSADPAIAATAAPGQAQFKRPYAFVDGSYNPKTGIAGWGGFLVLEDGTEIALSGTTDNPDMTCMRNVAGEIMGAMDALQEAAGQGLDRLDIYYDYLGIEMWATGAWKTNKPGTMAYAAFMQTYAKEVNIALNFVKVPAHAGIPGNERADQMAKQAVGL